MTSWLPSLLMKISGVFQVRRGSHFRNCQVGAGEFRIMEFGPEEDFRQDVADFLGDAELALRWANRALARRRVPAPLRRR